MSKLESKWKESWSLKPSLLGRAKIVSDRIWDFLYNAFKADDFWFWFTYSKKWKLWISGLTEAKYDDFMLCGENYIRAKYWSKWRLLDKHGKEKENFEVDEINDYTYDFTKWFNWISEWRIYSIDWKRWMIADDWTIIPADYDEIYIRDRDVGGFSYLTAVWKKTLESWEIKMWEISLKDWSIQEYEEEQDEIDDEWEKPLRWELKDSLYNNFLRERIKIYEWWKKSKIFTYMQDWKIWIKWILEPKYDDIYAPFWWYSIGIVRSGEKLWLISLRDGSIVREVEFDKIIEDSKNNSLILTKWEDIEEIFCENFKETKQSKKADN